MQCIFCKIINKQVEALIVLEDEFNIAIMDAFPVVEGHILVMPKCHKVYMTELDDEILSKTICFIKKISIKCFKDFHILQNNGKLASQMVDHVHFHIIPKDKNSKINLHSVWKPILISKDRLTNIFIQIKEKLQLE